MEEMDKEFIKSRYVNTLGNFYKMRRGRFHFLGISLHKIQEGMKNLIKAVEV
jgi:molybdate-binding protein